MVARSADDGVKRAMSFVWRTAVDGRHADSVPGLRWEWGPGAGRYGAGSGPPDLVRRVVRAVRHRCRGVVRCAVLVRTLWGGVAGVSELVCAWDLAAGDLLPGGETLVSVGRDGGSGWVRVAGSDGAVQSLPGVARVVVVERSTEIGPPVEPPLSPRERFRARQQLDRAADRR